MILRRVTSKFAGRNGYDRRLESKSTMRPSFTSSYSSFHMHRKGFDLTYTLLRRFDTDEVENQ